MASQSSQAFYSPQLNKSANIACRLDPKTRSYIILWRDVQLFCPNARYASFGEDTIPFLVDDDFNDIIPLRIVPQPGKVLSVVANDETLQQAPAPVHPYPAFGDIAPFSSTIPAMASLPSLSRHAKFSSVSNLSLSMSSPSSASNINIGSASGSNTTTQTLCLSATTTATVPGPILGSQGVSSVSMTGQEGAAIAHNADQSSIDIMTRAKKYTKHLRESEWHEAPSPRLFIVLPVASATEGYLFYWLCEDFSSGDLIPHLIHEPGIDLRSPNQFFRTYGEILLLGLYLFKSTKDISTDDERWYDQGISFLGRELCCSHKEAEVEIDRMIKNLQRSLSSHGMSGNLAKTASESLALSNDVYGIRSFLEKRRFSSSLSNERHHGLYRLVGEEGNIQWICSTHFYQARSEDFDPPFIQHILKDYGAYDVQRGLIAARVRSKPAAKAMNSIYDAAIKEFDSVSEFSLHLGWEATDPDLDELCSAVAEFNLVSVVVTSLDLRQRQSVIAKPIRHIFKCKRMQSFGLGTLCERRKLFDSLLLARRSSKLKSLRLALNAKGWDCQAIKENVDRVIGSLPTLETLDVRWDELEQVPHLESSLRSFAAGLCETHRVTMRGQTQEVTLTVDDFMQRSTQSSLLWTCIH